MKKLTDSQLWDEDWFLDLPIEYLLLFIYIKDRCDFAGIWKTNKKLIETLTNKNIDLNIAYGLYNAGKLRVIEVTESKWLLVDYYRFQYGKVFNLNNRVHKKIYELYSIEYQLNISEIWGQLGVKLGSKDIYIDKDNIKEIKIKEKDKIKEFNKEVYVFKEKYDTQMLDEFISYWTEKNINGKLMRFEMEKVFDISRRLSTWFKISKKNQSFEPDIQKPKAVKSKPLTAADKKFLKRMGYKNADEIIDNVTDKMTGNENS